MQKFEEIKSLLQQKTEFKENLFFYLPRISAFQKEEIAFHEAIFGAEEDAHQLLTLRNSFYHDYFKKYLLDLPKGSIVLEVGSGIGHDLLPLINKGLHIIASDISSGSLHYLQEKVKKHFTEDLSGQLAYLVADGEHLPFNNDSLDAIYMVACLHHFESQQNAVKEFNRVLRANGLIIFAIEPSRFMMFFTKIFANFKNLRIHQGESVADENHPGYLSKDFNKLLNKDFLIIKKKRVWLLQGVMHYFLEAWYRLFKLSSRVVPPQWLQYFFLGLDEILLLVPVINWFSWHWIIVAKKRVNI